MIVQKISCNLFENKILYILCFIMLNDIEIVTIIKGIIMNSKKSNLNVEDKISEHKKIVEKLRKSQETYRNLFNNAEVGMFRTKLDGSEVLNINEKLIEMLGWNREEVIGKPSKIHWVDPAQRKEVISKVIVNNRVVDFECKLFNKKGEVRTCLTSLNQYPKEGVIDGSIIDITERKQAEDLLINKRDDLRNLTKHMEAKVEVEKKKMARKLHDGLGQLLAAIKINCSLLRKKNLGNEVIPSELDEVLNLVDDCIQQVQEITKEMRSEILEDLGIFAAIYSKIHEFEEKYGIIVNMVCKPKNFYIDPEMSATIYKIYLELLTNILRHSQAKNVEIQFTKTKTNISLTVKDFGLGITEDQISSSFSFGLIGINERLYTWQGEMKIQGIPGKGTTVKIKIPLLGSK